MFLLEKKKKGTEEFETHNSLFASLKGDLVSVDLVYFVFVKDLVTF